MKSTLLLAAVAAAAVLTGVNTASAAEPFLSPKGKALANSTRTTLGTPTAVDQVQDRPTGNAKARELARSFRTVASVGLSIDLAHGPRPLLSPKDPRYEAALREQRTTTFQVAPLK